MKIIIRKSSEEARKEKENQMLEYTKKCTCPECGFNFNPPPIRRSDGKDIRECLKCGCEWETRD